MIGKGYLSIALVISALFLASGLLIIQSVQSGSAQGITGTFTADLQPRSGSNASGTATLEIQDNGKRIHYNIDATGLSNVTDISISQDTGTGRAPDVVIIRTASQSGLGPGSGALSGNFTDSELTGPLQGKNLADFVKAINDGKIIFRVQTVTFPLGEIAGNVTAGGNGGNATAGDVISNLSVNSQPVPSIPAIPSDTVNVTGEAMNTTANVTGEAMNTTANVTGEAMNVLSNATENATETTMNQAENIVNTAGNATANATGEAMSGLTNATAATGAAMEASANATGEAMSGLTNATENATGTAVESAKDIVSSAANTTANATGEAMSAITNATENATGTAMDSAKDILSSAANTTANATGELMTKANNVLSLASDAASNATQTA
ncbi:MAG: CHRD domain-containing protein, partial [Nitrososphaeraceae archaeon]|nr:CHRD domain-containing protein [Nitrososphaeraceae archaeon]